MGGPGSRGKRAWKKRIRAKIFERDGGRCIWCDKPVERGKTASLDHIVPRSLGGGSTQQNLVLACVTCNVQRSSKSAWDYLVERVGR